VHLEGHARIEIEIEIEIIMNPLRTSSEYLNVDLDWEFDAGTSVCENDLDYLADSTALSMMIKSNVMKYFPYHITAASDLPLIFTKETVAPLSHFQSSSDVHSVKTVSDTSSTDQSFCSASETSFESLDQALHKEKRPRTVKRTGKATVTTRRLGWKKPKDAPKRYLSAYNYFFQKERQRIYAESDERAGFSRLGKIIGQSWNSLTDDQRKPYEIMAEKDIDRYREEMKIYEDGRRRKYGRSLYRSPSSVTTGSTLTDDLQYPSPVRVSPDLHPALGSVKRQHHFTHHPPPPTVYAPLTIMSNQHHNGQYLNSGGQSAGQTQLQQYVQQQNPQVQYACVRMSRKKAQEYMRRHEGGQH
jgi:hypothetical protein